MNTITRLVLTAVGIGLIALDVIIPGTAIPGGAIVVAAWAIGGK